MCARKRRVGVWGRASSVKFWIPRPSEIVSDTILE